MNDLRLINCDNFTDLKCKFPNLTKLKIRNTKATILPELPENLSELDISETSITEITNGFPNNLEILDLRSSDLNEFKNIPNTLEFIDISSTPIASDSSKFNISVNRENVKTIKVEGFNYIPDCSNFTGLETFDMRNASKLEVSTLPSFPSSLKTLIIEDSSIQDISSLSSCNNLQVVELDRNDINDASSLSASSSTLILVRLNHNNITNGDFEAVL